MRKVEFQAVFSGSADPAVSSMEEIESEIRRSGQAPQAVVVVVDGQIVAGHAWPVTPGWEEGWH
jgi:hypothetical protein